LPACPLFGVGVGRGGVGGQCLCCLFDDTDHFTVSGRPTFEQETDWGCGGVFVRFE
jgi:hypothetical protein